MRFYFRNLSLFFDRYDGIAYLDVLKAFKIMGAIPQNVSFAVKPSFVKALMQSITDSLLTTKGIVVVPSNPEDRVQTSQKQYCSC
jgi:hypothetical protein